MSTLPLNSRLPQRHHRSLSTRLGVGAMALLVLTGITACGDEEEDGQFRIVDVWARPTPDAATNGAVYLTVFSPVDDVLESVAVPASVAATASMHETVEVMGGTDHEHGADQDGMDMAGMTGMEEMETVPLPSGEVLSFQPGGLHLMLEDLTEPLVDGDRFRMTLTFEEAGERDVEVEVSDTLSS